MSKYDLILEKSHPHVAQTARGFLYSDLAISSLNLANAAFKMGNLEIVKSQMNRARNYLEMKPTYVFMNDKITKAWKAGILVYETRAKFYCSQGIEIEQLQIDELERIERYPFRAERLNIEQMIKETENSLPSQS